MVARVISHMSKRSLMRAFNKALSLSPISYLIRVRMAKGVELLRREKMSNAEISHLVGYDDSNYFSRLFHATIGQTPSSYRRQWLAEQTALTTPLNGSTG